MTNWVPARWRQSLEQVRDEVQRAVNRWFQRNRRSDEEDDGLTWFRVAEEPRIDMEETDDVVRVIAELPGLDKDDFTLEISGGRLLLRGEKRHEHEKKGRGYYYAERSYGAFARAVALPCEVDPDKATARYKNGLLTVELPKTERAKTRHIPIAFAKGTRS